MFVSILVCPLLCTRTYPIDLKFAVRITEKTHEKMSKFCQRPDTLLVYKKKQSNDVEGYLRYYLLLTTI